jgi:hypothetical protein
VVAAIEKRLAQLAEGRVVRPSAGRWKIDEPATELMSETWEPTPREFAEPGRELLARRSLMSGSFAVPVVGGGWSPRPRKA